MKVLISRKDLRDTASGVPKIVLQQLDFFSSIGFKTYAISEVINKPMIKEFHGNPIKTIRWPFSGYFRRRFYQYQVQKWINKNRPDLVIGHGDIVEQDVLFIHNCVHLANELIEKCPLPKNHEVGRIHERILTRGKFKLLICNSKLMKNDLVKRFNLDPIKVEVIYPNINLSKFKVKDPEKIKKEWRKKLGIPQDVFVIGLVTSGNFKKRNLALLIEAFKEIYQKYPKSHLFVAGGNIDQKYKDMISDGVTFAPTLIDVKNYYYLLDVFCLPAHIEEFGLSVLEAMYCGKPVVTTKTVGASEIFEGRSRELVMDSPDKKVLIEMLCKLFDPLFYSEVREQNYITSLKFSSEHQNKKFEEVLKSHKILL
jgi:UDP-glucose:(heptosyl)LPS alpha-1,3-glucosyltransferase